ncbi:MAG: hypothetical protein MI824_21460, partial [Hyphomicrobiales bacterium]|nr:hypothetical protein [Hyphomicrobiales bacterium]
VTDHDLTPADADTSVLTIAGHGLDDRDTVAVRANGTSGASGQLVIDNVAYELYQVRVTGPSTFELIEVADVEALLDANALAGVADISDADWQALTAVVLTNAVPAATGFTVSIAGTNRVAVAQNGALGTHVLTAVDNSSSVVNDLATVDANNERIGLFQHGLAERTEVLYSALTERVSDTSSLADATNLNVEVGGLTNEARFYVVDTGDANTIKLLAIDDATLEARFGTDDVTELTAAQWTSIATDPAFLVDLSDASQSSLHVLSFIDNAKAFNPSSDVDSATDVFTIDNHGFETGDEVVYLNDQDANGTTVDITIQEADTKTVTVDGVDADNDLLFVPDHSFIGGEQVEYSFVGDGAIGGLDPTKSYVVDVEDPNQIGFKEIEDQTNFQIDTFFFDEYIFIEGLQGANVAIGDTVTVSQGAISSGAVTGLNLGETYTVTDIVDNYFQLTDASNTVVVAGQGDALGDLTFTFTHADTTSDALTVNLASIGSDNNTIQILSHGLTNGTLITYFTNSESIPDSNDDALTESVKIKGLAANESYFVVRVDNNAIKLVGALDVETYIENDDTPNSVADLQTSDWEALVDPNQEANAYSVEFSNEGGLHSFATLSDRVDLTDAATFPLGDHTFATADGVLTETVTIIQVDAANDQIKIHDHGYADGDEVLYDVGSDGTAPNFTSGEDLTPTSIDGLTDGTKYLVDVIDADTIRLVAIDTDVGSIDTAASVALYETDTTSTHNFISDAENISSQFTTTFASSDVSTGQSTITIAEHGLLTGQTVNYTSTGDTIGALANGGDLFVIVVDENTIQLAASEQDAYDGTALTFADAGSGDHTFTYGNAVTVKDIPIGGLQVGTVYYVVKLSDNTFRLSELELDTAESGPVDLTSLGEGDSHHLSRYDLTDGIGVVAELTTKNKTEAKVKIGSSFSPLNYIKAASTGDAGALAALAGGGGTLAGLSTNYDRQSEVGKQLNKNNSFSLTSSIAVNFVDHDVTAMVGETTRDGKVASLSSGSNVAITSSLEYVHQNFVQSSNDRKGASTKGGDKTVSIALGVAIGLNDVIAEIGSNAFVDADKTLTVKATTDIPYPTPPLEVITGLWDTNAWEKDGMKVFWDRMDGTFGFAKLLLNNWVNAYSKGEKGQVTFSGGLAVGVYLNNTTAKIGSGAQINQRNAATAEADQSVNVEARTEARLTTVAAVGNFGLSTSPLGKLIARKDAGKVLKEDVLVPGTRASGKAVGGSAAVNVIINTTEALVAPGAVIAIGNQGRLRVDADEDLLNIIWGHGGAQTDSTSTTSGAQQNKSSGWVFSGSIAVPIIISTTTAAIQVDEDDGATVSGGGDVTVDALANLMQLSIGGGLVFGTGGTNAFNNGIAFNWTDRTTSAYIGSSDRNADPLNLATIDLDVGDLAVAAKNTGGTFAIGVAGISTSDNRAKFGKDQSASDISDINLAKSDSKKYSTFSTPGTAWNGSLSFNFHFDETYAYILGSHIDSAGDTLDAFITADTASVTADQDTYIVGVAGSASLSRTTSSTTAKSKMVGGAVSVNVMKADTEAFVHGAKIVSTAPDLDNVNEIKVQATSRANIYAFPVAIAVATTGSQLQIAASIGINVMLNRTDSWIKSAAIDSAGDLLLKAQNSDRILSIGGAVAFSRTGSLGDTPGSSNHGVGGSFAFNMVSSQTRARILGTDLDPSVIAVNDQLDVEAVNDNDIFAIAVSVGATKSSSTTLKSAGGAVTVGINLVSTDPAVFSSGLDEKAHLLEASISDAIVVANGDITVSAKDDSSIFAIGGAAGVGVGGSGFGVALGWNQLAMNTRAVVSDATVTSLSGDITVKSRVTDEDTVVGDAKIISVSVGFGVSLQGGSSGVGGKHAAVGIAVTVNGILNVVEAAIENGAVVTAGGDVKVFAEDQSSIRSGAGGGSLNTNKQGNAGGAAVIAGFISNDVIAEISSSTVISTGGSVFVQADEEAEILAVAIGLSGADNFAFGGSLAIGVFDTNTRARITGSSVVTAHNNVIVTADNFSDGMIIAGGLAGSKKTAVGLAIATTTVVTKTRAYIDGASVVTADATDATATYTDVNGATRRGVIVEADSELEMFNFGLGGAVSKTTAGSGALTVMVVDDTTEAYIDSTGKITSGNDVVVLADAFWDDIVSAAGGLSGAKETAVGVGVDVSALTRRTKAYIGDDTVVSAKDGVRVEAQGRGEAWSVSMTAALSKKVSVGVSLEVGIVDFATEAYIGKRASVDTDGTVVVAAESNTSVDTIVGSLNVAIKGVAVGVSAGLGVVTINTHSWIDEDATVTGRAIDASAGERVNTGTFSNTSSAIGSADVESGFTSGDRSGNTISIAGHGFVTGQEVAYEADGNALGGLTSGDSYYVIVLNADEIQLARTKTGAVDGSAITLSGSGAGTDAHSLTLSNEIGSAEEQTFAVDDLTESASPTGTPSSIAIASHGYATGQEVVYTTDGEEIDGLSNGDTYYVIVLNSGEIRLAATSEDAFAGTAIALARGASISTDTHQLSPFNDIGIPSVDVEGDLGFSQAGLRADAFPDIESSVRKGVHVTSVSTNSLETFAIAAGGGKIGVEVAGELV